MEKAEADGSFIFHSNF